jgi:hypothetical protein
MIEYHQKWTLYKNIINYIQIYGVKSLLDIGAGGMELAGRLSLSVKDYLAIEKEREKYTALRGGGINAKFGKFPLTLDCKFDLVLSSHSIPEGDISEYDPFLSGAWNLVGVGGRFLVITFKGSKGEIASIRRNLIGSAPMEYEKYETVCNFMKSVANFEEQRVRSYITSDSVDELADYLLPWITSNIDIIQYIRPKLVDELERCYSLRDKLYGFPTEHLFLCAGPRV